MLEYSFFIEDIVNLDNRLLSAKLLHDFVLNKTCIFYLKGSSILKEIYINNIHINWYDISKCYQVYLNEYPVDKNTKIRVKDLSRVFLTEAIGLPSGEVLEMDRGDLSQLVEYRLIRFEFMYSFGNVNLKECYFFKDSDYDRIKEYLNWSEEIKKTYPIQDAALFN